mmetsp:Transcript_42597/g.99925  ORF Transcript_42597/g.99925 Transcript_42597/m.99925 type:complete len:207 (-) Transcript_42597:488-1108(-)
MGITFFEKRTLSLGAKSLSVLSLRVPACVGSCETIQGVKPPLPCTVTLAYPRTSSWTTSSMPLKAAWCKGVHPSTSCKSTSARPPSNSGTSSALPLRAATCKAERPLEFWIFILSRTPGFSCGCLMMISTVSLRPQKTADVRGDHPLASLKLTSAFFAKSSRTSLSDSLDMPFTSSALASSALRSSSSGLGAEGISKSLRASRFLL